MVAVTARMAAGLQVEAQASLDSRKHDNERQTDRKPGQGRTPIAREVRAACVVALQEDDAALSKAGIHTALGSVYPLCQCRPPAVCAEAWTQRASRSPCSLRAGSPWHDGCLCLSVCQVCKEQGRNSGSQHGRGNHERKRSSLSSAVAKKVAKGVHVGQRQEHVKRAGTRMQAQSTAAANVRA